MDALGELWQNIFSSTQRKMEVVVGATLGGAPPILCVASRGKAGSGHGWATWVPFSLSRSWIPPDRGIRHGSRKERWLVLDGFGMCWDLLMVVIDGGRHNKAMVMAQGRGHGWEP